MTKKLIQSDWITSVVETEGDKTTVVPLSAKQFEKFLERYDLTVDETATKGLKVYGVRRKNG